MEQASPADGRRLGLRKSSDEQTLPADRDSEAAPSACRMVSGGMSEVRCWVRVPLNPEVGDGFVEVDLGEEAIGGAEAVVYEAAEGVDTLEIGTSKGGLEVERDRAASRGVGGREQSGGGNGADIASFARVFHAKGITPPGSIGLVEQRLGLTDVLHAVSYRWPCIWTSVCSRSLRRLPAYSCPYCASLASRPTLDHGTSGSEATAGLSPCRDDLLCCLDDTRLQSPDLMLTLSPVDLFPLRSRAGGCTHGLLHIHLRFLL
jgi:hypothetical protein